MCLILFAYQCHTRYPLVLAANRDEVYRRPSQAVAFWNEHPEVLAGRDLEAGGTWLGITRQGRFAALTNYRAPALYKKDALSRGRLVSGFLTGSQPALAYLSQVQQERERYNPFNLLVGEKGKLYYYSQLKNRIEEVEPGIHGLSNSFLDTPWPKVLKGKKALQSVLEKEDFTPQELLEILADRESFEDHHLPDTGVGIEWERLLAPICIVSPDYGTRSSTVLLLDRYNHAIMLEKSLKEDKTGFDQVLYELDLVE